MYMLQQQLYTGTLLLPSKTSINERLLVHQSLQIIIGMSIGYMLRYGLERPVGIRI